MTLQEFISKYQGKTIGYPSGSYVGECLSLVKQYIKEVFNFDPPASGCNGARCYWSIFPDPLGKYFTKVPKTPEAVPKPGDIAIWNEKMGQGFGHIEIVTEANVNSFKSFGQNYGGKHAHFTTHNYSNVYGWLTPLKPENKPIGGQMEIEKKLFEELVGKSTKYDEFVNAGFSDPKAVSEEIEKLKKSRKNLEKALETTEKALADKALYVTDLEAERETLKKQIRDLKEELEAPNGAVDPTHFANTLAVLQGKADAILDSVADLTAELQKEKVLKAIQDQTKAIDNLIKNISSTPTDQVPNKSLIQVIVDWLERKK